MDKQTKTKRREYNQEKVKECQRQDFLKYKEANPGESQTNGQTNKNKKTRM